MSPIPLIFSCKMVLGNVRMDQSLLILVLVIVVTIVIVLLSRRREHYRDPIYLNKAKLNCDWYPRANGTIYGYRSHVLSGFPYYNKAY